MLPEQHEGHIRCALLKVVMIFGGDIWGYANLVAGAEGKAAVEDNREEILISFVPVDIVSQLCV